MKYKSLNLIFLVTTLVLASMLLSVSSVSGAAFPNNITILKPLSGGTVSNTFVLNATNATTGSKFTIYNCSFYARSLGKTANQTWVKLNNTAFTNVSHGGSSNGTFQSWVLEDGNDYQFNVTCWDGSSNIATAPLATGVIIDNKIPQAPSSLLPVSKAVNNNGTVSFLGTVVDQNTTSCTLFFLGRNPGRSSYAMDYSTTGCSKSLTMPEESYVYYIQASDETNTTNSAETPFSIDIQTSAGKTALLATQPGVKATGGATLSIVSTVTGGFIPGTGIPYWFIILFVLVIVAIVLIYKFS